MSDSDAPSVRLATDSVVDATVEVSDSRMTELGGVTIRRALPQRSRRTVGAWCFVDHMGPATVTPNRGLDIGPHPHIGLQTVTWLLAGEVLHRDSVGSEQVIRPGQLNLMTAGHGVSHAEEATSYAGELQGAQLWVAQPTATRHDGADFEHHASLPQVELDAGVASVLVGDFAGASSPARRDTDHVGVDLDLHGGESPIPLEPSFEYAVVVMDGEVAIDGGHIQPGVLAYLGLGRAELLLRATTSSRALLIGGVPFPEPILMWWNYVARDREEVSQAHAEWTSGSERFGQVASSLPRIGVGPPPWTAHPAEEHQR